MPKNIDADPAKSQDDVLAGLLIDELHKFKSGNLTIAQIEWFLKLPKAIREALVAKGRITLEQLALIDEAPEVSNPYLRRIATGTLSATQGKRTLAQAKETFPGYLDHNFENYGTNVEDGPKEAILFEVYELVKDGQFQQIFNGFGVELDKLCWSQDQIITFVENHADLLHPQGYATFFLFKVGKEFFVAGVDRDGRGQLGACVRRLSSGDVWIAGFRSRFVLPQLTV